MSAVLTPSPILQFFDSNSVELTGGLLFVYLAGTTTKTSVFTDSSGATAFPNPIILNSRGEPTVGGASLGIWLTSGVAYKFVLSPSTDTDPPTNPIWTIDNVSSGGGSSGTAAGIQTISDTGAVNALAVALSPAPVSYALGISFIVKIANSTTGATTINVNGLGAKNVTFNGSSLATGALMANQVYLMAYDGTTFEVLSVLAASGWVTSAYLAPIASQTVLGNNTGGSASPTAIPLTSITGSFSSGQYGFFASSTLPTGWLLCNGAAVSRTTYSALFAVVSTTYGVGDGSTTFNLPNFQGIFPRGLNTTGAGSDPSRTLSGTPQGFAMQGHYHNTLSGNNFVSYATPGSGTANATIGGGNYQRETSTGSPITDGTNGTPATTTETRPINLAMVIAIKT